jgi:2-methylcitrate dehydratase PrpD
MHGVILRTNSPVLAALLALAEARHLCGRDLIDAYVCRFEVGARVGNTAPAHYDGSWFVTVTLGTIAVGRRRSRAIHQPASTSCGGKRAI